MALLVEYCGSGYGGSQYQPNRPTIQQSLEDAFAALNLTTSAVSFAGRTDAGVNARGQVGHVDVKRGELDNVPDLVLALNNKLPQDVSVRSANPEAPHQFNSRRDARAKWYRYRIHNSSGRSVWAQSQWAAHVWPELDADAMAEAARLVEGTRNFKSFKAANSETDNDFCHVSAFKVSRQQEMVVLDIVADRFLYKMVRNLAGQLIAIGKGQPPEDILRVLDSNDRTVAAPMAPAEGLTLMAIDYPEPFDFFRETPLVQEMRATFPLPVITSEKPMESKQHENLFRKAS